MRTQLLNVCYNTCDVPPAWCPLTDVGTYLIAIAATILILIPLIIVNKIRMKR